MATPRKTTTRTKKAAPRTAAQIHQGRKTEKAVQAPDIEPTSVEQWKSRTRARGLKLPSGFTALVRNPGMTVFVERGLIPNGLMDIILGAINEQKPPSQRELKSMTKDPAKVAETIEFANSVAIECVVTPKVHPVPLWDDEHRQSGYCRKEEVGQPIPLGSPYRDDTMLFVDEVDLDDKMFILQWVVGGTHDLEQFREESVAAVADLSPGKVVGRTTKRAPRSR